MYPILSALVFAAGVLLLHFADRVSHKKPLILCFRVIGAALAVFGVIMFYLLISGRISLPLA